MTRRKQETRIKHLSHLSEYLYYAKLESLDQACDARHDLELFFFAYQLRQFFLDVAHNLFWMGSLLLLSHCNFAVVADQFLNDLLTKRLSVSVFLDDLLQLRLDEVLLVKLYSVQSHDALVFHLRSDAHVVVQLVALCLRLPPHARVLVLFIFRHC